MKIFTFLSLLLSIFTLSCNSGINSIFGNKTPHEKYEDRIEDLDLDETPQGKAWKEASERALGQPVQVALPFALNGHFPGDKPRALGLEFSAKRGEKLSFAIAKKNLNPIVIYADLFKKNESDADHVYSAEVDSTNSQFEIEETGTYVLRLQPQLNQSGQYSLTINTGPSLSFPVSHKKANVGSFWGDDRDGGKRRHEGIDIFAPKGSPATASADGYITSVSEGGLGGKTVWLRPTGKNYSLYYAHLDEQLVNEGQFVKKGDIVGTVGNTGNARTTTAHLHFGIYTYDGAVDPFPFVNRNVKNAASAASKELATSLKLTKSQKTMNGTSIKANTVLIPIAVTARNYIAELPDGTLINAPFAAVKAVKENPQNQNLVITVQPGGKRKS